MYYLYNQKKFTEGENMKSPVQGNTGPQRGNEQTDKSCKVTLGPDWKGSLRGKEKRRTACRMCTNILTIGCFFWW